MIGVPLKFMSTTQGPKPKFNGVPQRVKGGHNLHWWPQVFFKPTCSYMYNILFVYSTYCHSYYSTWLPKPNTDFSTLHYV